MILNPVLCELKIYMWSLPFYGSVDCCKAQAYMVGWKFRILEQFLSLEVIITDFLKVLLGHFGVLVVSQWNLVQLWIEDRQTVDYL